MHWTRVRTHFNSRMARGKRSKTGRKPKNTQKKSQQNVKAAFPKPSVRSSTSRRQGSSTSSGYSERSRFSPADSARLSQRDRARSLPSLNLRNASIGFVRSADSLDRDQSGSDQDAVDNPEADALDRDNPRLFLSTERPSVLDGVFHSSPTSTPHAKMSVNSSPSTNGLRRRADSLQHQGQLNTLELYARPFSPSPSNSSEEIVVFGGRNPRCNEKTRARHQEEDTAPIRKWVKPSATKSPHRERAFSARRLEEPHWDDSTVSWVHRSERKLAAKPPNEPRFGKVKTRLSTEKTRQHTPKADSNPNDILDDYVNNMRESGTIEDTWQTHPHKSQQDQHYDGWSRADINDFDDLSTSEEMHDAVSQILSTRHRPTGIQYLVVWDGQVVDEARWIPHSALTMPGASQLIRAFEEEKQQVRGFQGPNADSGDESDAEQESDSEWLDEGKRKGLYESEELDDEEEEDLLVRRQERMTDSHLARLLSTQEELGLGSDKLQIFNEEDYLDAEEELELTSTLNAAKNSTRKRHGWGASKTRADPKYAALDELLDAEDDGNYDVMDWQRANMSARNQSRTDVASFGLSDDDLALKLAETFARDRKKKKAKKQERQELRVRGLLSKKNKARPNPAMKYRTGIDMDQIRAELENFLEQNFET